MTSAKLFILGEERELLWIDTNYYRYLTTFGSPASNIEGGLITLCFVSQEGDDVFFHNMTKDVEKETDRMEKGEVHFYNKGEEDIPIRKYKFSDAFLVEFSETFYAHGTENLRTVLTISPAIQNYGTTHDLIKHWKVSRIPLAESYYVPKKEEERIVYINGHFYNKDGTFEGKINESDYEGSIEDVYVCDGKSTQKNSNGKDFTTYNNTKLLKDNDVNVGHNKFINLASIVYGESSFPYLKKDDENLKFEMFSIASVNHNYKETAFGENSVAAKDFRKKTLEERNDTKMQLAISGVINTLIGGLDYSNGARYWDGKEQALYSESDDRLKDKKDDGRSYIIHMNTRGWKILDDHYEKWKKAIGSSFQGPQVKYSPSGVNKGKITYESTAVWGRTIFWKDVMYVEETKK